MCRVFLFAIYFFAFGLAVLPASPEPAGVADADEAAKATAQAYLDLFSQDETFTNHLGEATYDAIFYNFGDDGSHQITPEAQQLALQHVEAKLERLSELASAPRVDWGRQQAFEEKGMNALVPEVGSIRRLAAEASWYAKQTWKEDPQKALASLRDAQTAARHFGQDIPSLISKLTQIAVESILINTFAELAPKMTREQMNAALAGIETLPPTGSLADAIRTERDFVTGWLRRKIEDELSAWEESAYGTHGFRFPADLRLAGVVLLPGRPLRLSLHNTRAGQTFWLEEGSEVNGIRIERAEHTPPRAWLAYGNLRAVVNLEKETIQNRYVPWDVLISVFGSFGGKGEQNLTDAEKEKRKEQLAEFGLSPETVLDNLDQLDAFYSGAIERLDLPAEAYQAWEDEYRTGAVGNKFFEIMMPRLGKIIEVDRAFNAKYDALAIGFAVQAGDSERPPAREGYVVVQNPQGFTVTPKQFVGHQQEHSYSLHFGTPPPEPE